MSEVHWRIPPAMSRLLARAPADRAVVVLLRHSVRDHLPPGDAGYVLPITATGQRLASDLGTLLRGRLRTLHTSPLVRCVQTAESLAGGAGSDLPITTNRLLGDPGAFVIDGRLAAGNWDRLGHHGVMRHLVGQCDPLSGMARPDEAARFLVQSMFAVAADRPGLHVFVSHDSLVLATAARLLGKALGEDDCPWYLEGAFFWNDDDGVHTAYRDDEVVRPEPLCGLVNDEVIELARRELAATIGLDSTARVFLAGGAFKSLLTGRPPRDLDLWAPTSIDRVSILRTLEARGTRPAGPRPLSDAFEIAGRVVDVAHAVGPETLAERLACFDLGLCAVGVEHQGNAEWSAMIHPLASESVRRREVLLLEPFANWKYALTTLERMRRYGHELGFAVPPAAEAAVWRVFEGQDPEVRAQMIERYRRTGMCTFDVRRHARGPRALAVSGRCRDSRRATSRIATPAAPACSRPTPAPILRPCPAAPPPVGLGEREGERFAGAWARLMA